MLVELYLPACDAEYAFAPAVSSQDRRSNLAVMFLLHQFFKCNHFEPG